MILMAVSLAVQKPAPASGLSQYGNTGAGSFANTADRAYHMASRAGQTARHPRRSDLPRPFSFHQVSSYSAIAPTTVTALSFENTPTAVAAIRPASQAHRRPPWVSALFRYIQNPPSSDMPASKSARPTILVTASVRTGWTAQTAATKTAGHGFRISRSARAYTSSTLPVCNRKLIQW